MPKFLSHFGKLWDAISSNVIFLLEFVGIIAAIFVIAYVVERAIKKKNNDTGKILTTRKVAVIGVMSAISGILMCFEIPLWFAPPFYKLDFSELPVLICGFAFGPVAGVLAEAVKILIKLILKGTSTAFVGDLANFVVGCSFILTATIIYHIKKNKKTATVKKQKTTKVTIKKLKAKKKYYVRIRTYKTVNGKKVYSSWSKVKSVKTK